MRTTIKVYDDMGQAIHEMIGTNENFGVEFDTPIIVDNKKLLGYSVKFFTKELDYEERKK